MDKRRILYQEPLIFKLIKGKIVSIAYINKMGRAIEEYSWLESEKAGHDVSEEAKVKWEKNHFPEFDRINGPAISIFSR